MPVVAMIEHSPLASVVTNPRLPDNPIIACNPAFELLTGYSRAEVLGRNCAFLAGERKKRLLSNQLRVAVLERRPLMAQVKNFRKDGTPFLNAVLIVPIFDGEGKLTYFLGSQAEVTDGNTTNHPEISDRSSRKLSSLTNRQQQVLSCLISGMRNKQIAFQLGITERTVKMHRSDLQAALEVKCSAEAIRIAAEAGWHRVINVEVTHS